MKLFSPQQMPNKHEWTSIGDLLLDLPHDFWIFRHFHCFRMVRDRRTWLQLSDMVKAVVTMEPWRHWRAENMDSSAGSFIAVICWNKTFSQMSGLYMFISGFLGCFFLMESKQDPLPVRFYLWPSTHVMFLQDSANFQPNPPIPAWFFGAPGHPRGTHRAPTPSSHGRRHGRRRCGGGAAAGAPEPGAGGAGAGGTGERPWALWGLIINKVN